MILSLVFAQPLIITKEELDHTAKNKTCISIMSKSCNNQFVRALKRNTLCYNMFESEIVRVKEEAKGS